MLHICSTCTGYLNSFLYSFWRWLDRQQSDWCYWIQSAFIPWLRDTCCCHISRSHIFAAHVVIVHILVCHISRYMISLSTSKTSKPQHAVIWRSWCTFEMHVLRQYLISGLKAHAHASFHPKSRKRRMPRSLFERIMMNPSPSFKCSFVGKSRSDTACRRLFRLTEPYAALYAKYCYLNSMAVYLITNRLINTILCWWLHSCSWSTFQWFLTIQQCY